MNKNLLGRKILDLIEENHIQIKENEEIIEIDVNLIRPNPNQPRTSFNSTALKQLAESIREHGVIQPVILKPSPEGYILVAGERRVRASILAGKKTIPSVIRDYNAIYLTELSILENLQREDLTPIEEAIAYEKAIKNLGLTQAELGKKIGKSRSHITNMIGLLNLPLNVIEDVNRGLISMGHARVLSKIDDVEMVDFLSSKIKNDHLNVRKLEDLARKKSNKKGNKNSLKKDTDGYMPIVTKRLSDYFDSDISVNISSSEIRIKFKDKKTLLQILDNMRGDKNGQSS